MKWSTVTVGVMILGIIGVSIILLFQQLTTTNENDYYLLKEITEAAMVDSIDISYYRETGNLKIVREKLKEVGYDDSRYNMDYRTCKVDINITTQSTDIAQGVNIGGAGDQGIMFGYATDESEDYMPYPISIANRLAKQLSEVRKNGKIPCLKSDGKVQVTVEYVNDEPFRIDTILISTQHSENVDIEILQKDILKKVIMPIVKEDMIDVETKFYINPTGKFVLGGAIADTGLTGRKIMVDTYGGMARHGGGAFSGKDPSKVDRSAAYISRYIAKNIVAAGLCDRIEIQLSYAIGVKDPTSVHVDTYGTGKVADEVILDAIKKEFDLTPQGIINTLDLLNPIYGATAAYGHFGRTDVEFPWEKLNKVEDLKKYLA